jgi:hypothetical protein
VRTIWAGFFGSVVAGDDVEETKPDPMPYLTAARRLGADPRHCVAVEDSPNGLLSAAAAGCAVLGVPCEVPLAAGERTTLVASLLDVDLAFLRGLLGSDLGSAAGSDLGSAAGADLGSAAGADTGSAAGADQAGLVRQHHGLDPVA